MIFELIKSEDDQFRDNNSDDDDDDIPQFGQSTLFKLISCPLAKICLYRESYDMTLNLLVYVLLE